MTRFVALSTDSNPNYAIYAPIVTRLWRRLGYEPLLIILEPDPGWSTPLGHYVRESLPADLLIRSVPQTRPLTAANTMRVCRLAAAAFPEVDGEDIVMTSDIDMAPLSRTFFERDKEWELFVLRADFHGAIEKAVVDYAYGPVLVYGAVRFPMCYTSARASIWRDLFPMIRDQLPRSVERIVHGLPYDKHDYDESNCSMRILQSKYAIGQLHQIDETIWQQGMLRMVVMPEYCENRPLRMLLGNEGAHFDPNAIDMHMPRPTESWVGEALTRYWPEEIGFLQDYWPTALKLA